MENKFNKERMQNIRQCLLDNLKKEYLDLTNKAQRLHFFLHQVRLPDSELFLECKKTMKYNYWSYVNNMDEQLKAMDQYAEQLAYRIQYVQEEIELQIRDEQHEQLRKEGKCNECKGPINEEN